MIRLLRLRRLVQVAVLLLLAALPWLNRDGFTGMKGSLFAFDFFGLPFADPLGAVQIGLSGIIPGWRLIAGALVVLAVALCLGRIFCSWLCLSGSCPNSYTPSGAGVPKSRSNTDFGPGP